MQKQQLITAFKTHLKRLGYSPSSLHMLPACLQDFLQNQPHDQLSNITPTDIVAYHEHLKERPNKRRPGGLSESYIHHHIYSLKVFFGWQQEIGAILKNPISNLDFPKPQSKPRAILTLQEIRELYKACETSKERAILSLFYGCGLRRTEGEKLNLNDIHFRINLLYVREGKNSKRRVVPLSGKVQQDLWNYANQERKVSGLEPAFITNRSGRRMQGNEHNKALKTILERTDIDKAISLHCLRHSIATHLLESGLSVEYVRDFLGHKQLESTQIYTRVKKQQLWEL